MILAIAKTDAELLRDVSEMTAEEYEEHRNEILQALQRVWEKGMKEGNDAKKSYY